MAETRRYAKRQPREVRREQILDAALVLVARDGWPAMTMERIATEAGVAKSVAYAIFTSQGQLQHELMVREQERAFTASAGVLEAVAAHGADISEAVTAGLSEFLESVRRDPDTWRLIVLPIAGAPESVKGAIEAGRERWRAALEPVIDGVARQAGVPPVDSELAAHLARGTAEYLARLTLEDPEGFTIARLNAFVGQAAAVIGAR